MNEKENRLRQVFATGSTCRFVVAAFIFLHLLITLPLAFLLNAWIDEASTLYSTNNGFFDALQNVFRNEKQAPLYFWLLSLWRRIDASIFFARVFSIICSCLSITVFYNLARNYFNEKETILLTAFFAFHPYLIWASLEIRVYSMVILLSILLLKFFVEGYLHDRGTETRLKEQVIFVVLAVISIYTNYYLGFLLVGGFVALLTLRRRKSAKTYFLQMFIVGVAILPLAWAIRMQLELNTGGYQQTSGLIEGIRILWGHFLSFVFPTELFAPSEQTTISYFRVWLARFGILILILLLIRKNVFSIDERVLLFGSLTVVILAFLLFAFSILGGEYISVRHAAVLFVPLILLIAGLVANLLPQRTWVVLAVIFAMLFPYSIYSLYPTLAKRGDWFRIAKFIEANEARNQPIVFSQAYDALSLPFHYNGVNQVLPDEKFFDWDFEDSLQSENAFKKQTEFIISEIPQDAEYIWLLTRDNCHIKETAPSCRPLESFIETNYTVEIEKDFYLQKLRLLKKK